MKTATIGFRAGNGTTYYKRFNNLAEALRFVREYNGKLQICNLMYDGDEYFNVSENIVRIAKENRVNV